MYSYTSWWGHVQIGSTGSSLAAASVCRCEWFHAGMEESVAQNNTASLDNYR